MRRRLLTLGLALLLAPAAVADTVTLKNGRELHGQLVEEKADAIVLRTTGGSITIRKAEVATFNANDTIEPYLREVEPAGGPRTPATPATPGATERPGPAPRGPATGTEAAPPPAPGDAPKERPTKETWKWADGVTRERIRELTPARDKLLGELDKLGPTKEERLATTECTEEEAAEMDKLVDAFDRRASHVRRRNGQRVRGNNTRNQARRRAAGEISEWGSQAIPVLLETVVSDNSLTARMSAKALSTLKPDEEVKQEDLKWLLWHFEAPKLLISLMERQTAADSIIVRNDANTALVALAGQDFGFQLGKAVAPSPAETEAVRRAKEWWKAEHAKFLKDEEAKEARRAKVLVALEEVRQGRDPPKDEPARGRR